MKRCSPWLRCRFLWLLIAPFHVSTAQSASFEEIARKFAESDFVFNRARSDIPFVPLAWVSATVYEKSRFITPAGDVSDLAFQQETLSEATLIPVLLGSRDALVVGQWMSWTRFDLSSGDTAEVFSLAAPIGWVRQTSADWQVAAFVAPLGHKNSGHISNDDGWYWEYMGGVFARYIHSERFAWIFGFYADVAPLEDFYVPYAGLTWTIDQRWTLSAVMPWPAVLYAPTPDWLLRLGVAPSDASWSTDIDAASGRLKQPRINFSAWNFGFSVQRRLWKNIWLGAEAGVSGLRGFSFAGSDWEGPNADLGAEGYASVTVNFRPQAPDSSP